MSGDCPECGQPVVWRWLEHTQEAHERTRARLYEAIGRLLDREATARLRGAQADVQGCVAIRWRCGALRGPGNEWWTDVPDELMQEAERNHPFWTDSLAGIRSTLADYVHNVYGMEVNPATFRHRIYGDPR